MHPRPIVETSSPLVPSFRFSTSPLPSFAEPRLHGSRHAARPSATSAGAGISGAASARITPGIPRISARALSRPLPPGSDRARARASYGPRTSWARRTPGTPRRNPAIGPVSLSVSMSRYASIGLLPASRGGSVDSTSTIGWGAPYSHRPPFVNRCHVTENGMCYDVPMQERTMGLRERKKQRTRAELTEAAILLFTDRGFDATTIEDIVGEVEVSPRTFFRYFDSKEDVVIGFFDDMGVELRGMLAARPQGEAPFTAVRRALGALIELFTTELDRGQPLGGQRRAGRPEGAAEPIPRRRGHRTRSHPTGLGRLSAGRHRSDNPPFLCLWVPVTRSAMITPPCRTRG